MKKVQLKNLKYYIIVYYEVRNKKKQQQPPPIYDDKTLEHMKRYYKIESDHELLRYIKRHGLRVDDGDEDIPASSL